jgi:hypothetical protein
VHEDEDEDVNVGDSADGHGKGNGPVRLIQTIVFSECIVVSGIASPSAFSHHFAFHPLPSIRIAS